ncbi:hypothetical protein DFH09DRAFT_948350 [Mycena vulgaris]|nr:hypothetical protein DFH09DRAFT_948350 [Mycena vulgaris]
MCLIISDPNDTDATLHSDHLNAVQLIDDSKTVVDQQAHLRSMNGRSYYRWILRFIADNPIRILYTPGHSTEVSVPARFNFEADHYASSGQHHLRDIFTAPIPTFHMDDYTFHTRDDGWIESNIRTYVEKSQIIDAMKRVSAGHQQRMALHLYDTKPPPKYSYTTAYSAYSAVVQLDAQSGQLPTADISHSRGKMDDPRCRMGCDAIDDQHHIFVECPQYAKWRTKAAEEVYRHTNTKLAEKEIEEVARVDLLSTVMFLYSDNTLIWPLQYCTFYLGHLPRFDHLIPKRIGNAGDSLMRTHLAHHLASDWHTAAIRLAGRIWGSGQRETRG